MNSPLKNIVESLIFVSQEPLTSERIQAVLEGVPAADIQAAVDELIADTAADGRGVQIIHVGGGWLFSTKPAFDREVRRLLQIERKNRLSSAGLETLAAIAYRQPVTQAEVSAIRGVDSTSSLKTLLERPDQDRRTEEGAGKPARLQDVRRVPSLPGAQRPRRTPLRGGDRQDPAGG